MATLLTKTFIRSLYHMPVNSADKSCENVEKDMHKLNGMNFQCKPLLSSTSCNTNSSQFSSSNRLPIAKPLALTSTNICGEKIKKGHTESSQSGLESSLMMRDSFASNESQKRLQIDSDNDTPLHIFIAKCNSNFPRDEAEDNACAEFLLSRETYFKPYVNIPDKYQQTPLHIAVFLKNVHLVFALLQLGADWCYYDCRLETPLHAAVSLAHGKQDGATLDLSSNNEEEAYLTFPTNHVDAKSTNQIKDPELLSINVLLSFKNDKMPKFIDAKNDKGQAAMHIAAEKERYDIMTLLKSHGADVNVQENKSGFTPLMILIKKLVYLKNEIKQQHQMIQNIKRFIFDMKPDLNVSSYSKDTALHLACMVDCEDLVKCLLDNGANVNEKNMCRKSEKDLTTSVQIKNLLERKFRKKRRQRKRESDD